MGSGMVGLYLKGMREGQLFALLRKWLTLGGATRQSEQGPGCQNIRIQKMKDMVNTVSAEYA